MYQIGIDIETYCAARLPDVGVYRYAEDETFRVLLFGYAVDGGPVRCVDLESGESLPDDIRRALTDPTITKTAYNATFERVCLSRWLGLDRPMPPEGWQCTMVAAARLGMPLSLAKCAEALRLEKGKMDEGRALIRYFSVPGRSGERHRPADAPDKWATFKAYNIRDVEVEQAVLKKVSGLAQPAFETELYCADQRINDRGVRIDTRLVRNAERFDNDYKAELMAKARELTGLDKPNDPRRIKEWIAQLTGFAVTSLDKRSLDDLSKRLAYWPKAQQLLALRREMGKTSNKKYGAMLQCLCRDGRIHGLLQYYGAARTGRWAGRLVQVQNLPQNHLESIAEARRMVRQGDLETFELFYGDVAQVLSELIRTAFIPAEGREFHVCDFSAIEARVIAWIAGETWVTDAFREGKDIYCETASRMFHVPVEKHGRNAHLRQRGKVAVLALGYGGGPAALEAMGGSRLGLTESEERDIVRMWRQSNPYIVRLWANVEKAAVRAIKTGEPTAINRGIAFGSWRGCLTVTLPSGRTLCYPRARIGEEWDGRSQTWRPAIEYEGTNQITGKWGTVRTYGGKLTENIVQATARDILGCVLLRAERQGLDVVFHIHDEIIVEGRPGADTLAAVEAIFSKPVPWAPTLPLKGAGFSTPFYMKD